MAGAHFALTFPAPAKPRPGPSPGQPESVTILEKDAARPDYFVGIDTRPELIPYVRHVWPIEHDEVLWPPERVLTTAQLKDYVGGDEARRSSK